MLNNFHYDFIITQVLATSISMIFNDFHKTVIDQYKFDFL